MASFNSVVLLGNLARDPELRYTPQGSPVCTFAAATNARTRTDESERTVLVDVEVWGRLAEICTQFLKKGRQVLVVGELRQDRWVDEATQRPRSKLFVVAREVKFLGPKGSEVTEPHEENAVPE